MVGDGSAFSALGLEPGADGVAIERAYKQLIKLHHPDREGGDAMRAAEINRAYRELRGSPGPQDTLVLMESDAIPKTRGGGWIGAALVLVVAVAALLAVTGPLPAYIRQLLPAPGLTLPSGGAVPAAAGMDAMEQPLHVAAITGAVREAVSMLGRDDSALLGASRDCHRELRLEPSVTQLDRCAAFDDAVVALQDHDPMWDEGPFSQIAVTGRQWSAASALSTDYLAIDGRLDRIRIQVELSLAPPAPPRLPTAPSLAPTNPVAD